MAEIGILVALVAGLAFAFYRDLSPSATATTDNPSPGLVEALRIPSPELHLGRLEALQKMNYEGTDRNIFNAAPPPPPPAPASKKSKAENAASSAPVVPPPPPPLQVPLTYYGTVTDPKSGREEAFFTNGDHIYIAAPGDVLLGRYKLVSIGIKTAEFEDVPTSRTATLTMMLPVKQ